MSRRRRVVYLLHFSSCYYVNRDAQCKYQFGHDVLFCSDTDGWCLPRMLLKSYGVHKYAARRIALESGVDANGCAGRDPARRSAPRELLLKKYIVGERRSWRGVANFCETRVRFRFQSCILIIDALSSRLELTSSYPGEVHTHTPNPNQARPGHAWGQ